MNPRVGVIHSGDGQKEFKLPSAPSNEGVSCLVADDHPAVLEAVADYLEAAGVRVAGRARDGEEALSKIESLRPRIALVDLRMPKVGGIEVARRVSRSHPETYVVLYTGYGDRAQLTEALDAGARGFVLKEAPLEDLVRAIETVARGDTYVAPVLAGVLASAGLTGKLPSLTQREREVLRLLADGLSNEEIGKRLFISAETVRTHVRKAMDKLDADTRTQAVAKAIRQSLIA
jgi:DNA-binding NarL/FixJ family response regulator